MEFCVGVYSEVSVNFTVCSPILLQTMIIVYMRLVLNLAHISKTESFYNIFEHA